MTYQEVLENARTCIGPFCKACPVCNGKACGNKVPGPGAKGTGTVAIQNYDACRRSVSIWILSARINRWTPHSNFFGQTFKYPIFAGPVGTMKLHYGDKYDDQEYNSILVSACCGRGDRGVYRRRDQSGGDGGSDPGYQGSRRKRHPYDQAWDINTLKKNLRW